MFFLAKVLVGSIAYVILRLLYGKHFALLYIQIFVYVYIFRTQVFLFIRRHGIAMLLYLTVANHTR